MRIAIFLTINKKYETQKAYKKTTICFSYQQSIGLSVVSEYSLFSNFEHFPPTKMFVIFKNRWLKEQNLYIISNSFFEMGQQAFSVNFRKSSKIIWKTIKYRNSFLTFATTRKLSFQTVCRHLTRRERLKSALYLRLKNAVFEICVSFHEKLLFSDLRLLLTKAQYSSDKTSKVRL